MLPSRHSQNCTRQLGWLCVVGLVLLALGASADENYTVKPKDTLYDLARQHGISVGQLAERNGLSRNARLHVGQRLIVPAKHSAPPVAQSALNSSVQKSIDGARVTPGRWKYVV